MGKEMASLLIGLGVEIIVTIFGVVVRTMPIPLAITFGIIGLALILYGLVSIIRRRGKGSDASQSVADSTVGRDIIQANRDVNIFNEPKLEGKTTPLKTHELFDVVCPTTTMSLPLNLQKDGTWRTSSARLSPSPLYIIHRGDLITVKRVTVTPEVIFTYMDGSGWETTNAITVTPQRPLPALMSPPGAIDYAWDVTNPLQWVLTGGLPLTMGKDEHLHLPAMDIGVLDANLVGTHFTKLDWCKLVIRLTIRTDKGSPYLPDLFIELTSSDIPNPNPRYYWKDVTNESKD